MIATPNTSPRIRSGDEVTAQPTIGTRPYILQMTRQLDCRAMRILVLGGEGSLGWPTPLRLPAHGHEVTVADNSPRRTWHNEHSTDSLTPIASLASRLSAWES